MRMSRLSQDYLEKQKNMINFNKIFWGQMLTLCRALQASSSLDSETVERWYNAESLNFKETLEFLLESGVVTVTDNKILPSIALKKVIASDDESIRRFFVDTFFQKKSNFVKYFGEFFDNFELYGDLYRFIPRIKERLKYSGIRNFLISLGVLVFEPSYGGYTVTKELSTYLLDQNKILSYNEFVKKIRTAEVLGHAAELLVFEQEKEKFKSNPDLQKEIRHISLENVMAGYDIRSFEKQKEEGWVPKFIEVKAVSEDDWGFHWSKNEINKARQLGESYYLYLLPVKSEGVLDISELRQIKDPYRKVFQNQNEWVREIEIMAFYKK